MVQATAQARVQATKNTVQLSDVCRLAPEACIKLEVSERLLRKGPYPHYTDNCKPFGLEDYALPEGSCIMVPAFGQVVTPKGYVMATLEEGRCSCNEHVHALVPHDGADARYIWRAITHASGVSHHVAGTSQLRHLSAAGLLASQIPWPAREKRDAFVEMLDSCDAEHARLKDLTPQLLATGDEAFARIIMGADPAYVPVADVARWFKGSNVLAADRGEDKPVRVEGPRGRLGHCDGALSEEPIIAVGPVGKCVVAHYVGEPSHPVAEVRFTRAQDADVELAVLFFALRAAGVPEKAAIGDRGTHVTLEQFATLELPVGDEASRREFVQIGNEFLARLAQTERDLDALEHTRREGIAAFFNEINSERAPLPGAPLVPPTPHAPASGSPTASGAPSAPTSPAEAPIPPARLDKLGVLRPLAAEGIMLLGNPEDVAWELAPLAVLRACASPSQWAYVRAAAGSYAAAAGYTKLTNVLDTVMTEIAQTDDLLEFFPNLSYATSLLEPARLASWVASLNDIDSDRISAEIVRHIFDLIPGTCPLPQAVAQVFEAVVCSAATALPQAPEQIYVPYSASDGVIDLVGRHFPRVDVRAQAPEFSRILSDFMVRAVALKAERQTRGSLGEAPAEAIVEDVFPDWQADLVVSALPPNEADWQKGTLDGQDPRWALLGLPARNKANYAWLQQVLYHQKPGGISVILVSNAALHTMVGVEYKQRMLLAQSGRIRAILSFPARLFEDERAGMSLLVMSDEQTNPQCLMVNALGLGCETANPAMRDLDAATVQHIIDVVSLWLEQHRVQTEPGFCRATDMREIIDNACLLTPWSYT